jgi:hypothetical protein
MTANRILAGPSVSELNQMLTARISSLMPVLLPMGRQRHGEWVEASTRAGGMGDSLMVCMTGAKAGIWSHFAAGRSGDLIDLVAYLRTGGDVGAACAWARDWLGLGGGGAASVRPAAAIAEARAAAQARARAAAAEAETRAGRARAMWLGGASLAGGDVVDRYLTGRAIGLALLGRVPGCLRAMARLPHRTDGPGGARWPAMLAAVVGGDGVHLATHRTWLRDDGSGKAPVAPAKMVLGDYMGGHIPIWKGRHREPLHRLRAGVPLFVSEGIEDGLSVARLLPDARVIAAISISNMASLVLPDTVRELVLVAQNDPETLADGRPHPARLALDAAVRAHAAAGRVVKLARPPAPFKDFNDWVQALHHRGATGGAGVAVEAAA